VFAVVAEADPAAFLSDLGLRGIVVTIDAGERAGGYGGPTMKLAGRVQRHAFDAAVVALALVAQIEIWSTPMPVPREALAPIMLLATLPLLLRGRFPFAAPVCVFGLYAALSGADREAVSSLDTNTFTLLLAFWAIGAQDEARQAVAGVAIGGASIAVLVERDVRIEPADAIGVVIAGAGLSVAAFALQRRARRAAELEQRAVALEREREQRERVAVAEERRRIARDLHDVVAHGVGVMTVQAGAARLLLDDDPGRARAPLLAVEQTGRQALGELRRLLGILRADEPEPALRPQPGLADLEELVAQARDAGLPVELVIEGAPAPLPAGVDLAAYRIVQEGLTNTRKHAGPARACVAVRYAPEALELEISDDGRAGANGDGGHGLVGMRERVALYGGRLDAGPRPEGGFSIHARLPLQAARP
jgi:signal transduction histidine kinase